MPITAAGIGSGIDIETIVSQLMTLERQPLVNLQRRESVTGAQVSAYGKIKSAVASFQDAMAALSKVDKFKIFTAASSDEDVLSATADSDAAAGVYNIAVTRIAQNHKMGSNESTSSATFGGGVGDELTLTVGSDSTTIDLSTAKTLSEVRDTINAASDNPGVTATILNTGGGNQRLILTANDSGYDNRVQLTYGGAVDANTFGFATANQAPGGGALAALTDLDAAFTVDGYSITAASNKVTDVIDGMSLEFKQTGSITLSVDRDTSAIEESAQAFVKAYNDVLATLATQRSGQLSGDSTLRSIERQMRDVLNTQPSGLTGSVTALSQVGIKTDAKTGRLTLDSSEFSDALTSDFDGVAQLFANDDQGYAFRFEALADAMLDTDGVIDSRVDGLNDRIRDLKDGQADMSRRLELKEKALRSQYAALDSLVGSLQSTSSFLLQQLG